MTRIKNCFESLKKEGRGAVIPYVEAFDPDRETSLSLLREMANTGADLIEVGIPFSDPSADGPVIQLAARRALKAGASLAGVLELVRLFRQENTQIPIILMGYLNPIERYGHDRFCQDAAKAGADGVIIVDLPPEESGLLASSLRQNGLDLITLVSPNTPDSRLQKILADASGFVYFASITGVTGGKSGTEDDIRSMMQRLRPVTNLPVVTGFGIKTPEQVRIATTLSDGAVMATVLIKTMAETYENDRATARTIPAVMEKIRLFAKAARKT